MQHSTRRDLREKLYQAFISRASTGELDNTPLIERILELRKEKAMLLGFEQDSAAHPTLVPDRVKR
jgi:oligopeptidase A